MTIDKTTFMEEGYSSIPGFFSSVESNLMLNELKKLAKFQPKSKRLIPSSLFERLIIHPRILSVVRTILGEEFFFHHANGRYVAEPSSSKKWHHDYDWETIDASHPLDGCDMLHLMMYPIGLNPENGQLKVLPGSHRSPCSRSTPNLFDARDLPGSRNIQCEPGRLILLNSATWHARETASSARAHINFVFCKSISHHPERFDWTNEIDYMYRKCPDDFKYLFIRENGGRV